MEMDDTAIDPTDPNIIYAESQQGFDVLTVVRVRVFVFNLSRVGTKNLSDSTGIHQSD